MTVRTYAVGEAVIQVWSADSRLVTQLDQLWQLLFSVRTIDPRTASPTIQLCFRQRAKTGTQSRMLEENPLAERVRTWPTAQGYTVQCGAAQLALDLGRSQGVGLLPPAFWSYPLVEQREFFLLSLLMLLHCHGHYGLHANGLVHNKTGYLVVGESGSGKSTLTVSLLNAGWFYVADDALVLRRNQQEVAAWGLRCGIACRSDLATHFPALAALLAQSPALAHGKRLLATEQLWPHQLRTVCTPRVILFPTISGGSRSQLVALDATSVLARLMHLSTGILTDRSRVQQQMATLKYLVQQAPAYQLGLGEDLFAEPGLVVDQLVRCAA